MNLDIWPASCCNSRFGAETTADDAVADVDLIAVVWMIEERRRRRGMNIGGLVMRTKRWRKRMKRGR